MVLDFYILTHLQFYKMNVLRLYLLRFSHSPHWNPPPFMNDRRLHTSAVENLAFLLSMDSLTYNTLGYSRYT